jgi:hypothetical protein
LDANYPEEAGPPRSRPRVSIFVLAGSLLVLGIGVVWTRWPAGYAPGRLAAGHERLAGSWPETPWKNARPGVKYVGDAACTHCHGEIAETFRRHPMGRSLAPIARAPAVGGDRSDGATTFEAGSSRFTIERRGGRVVHRETRLDEKGQILAQVEAEVKYALGSGTRGISYLVEHDGRLFQSPISWYSQKNRWDISPGYEKRSLHFNRPIEPSCLFCHANRVEPVDLSVNQYEAPVFRGEAIGCERCHGPGELHAQQQVVVDGRDLTIVNPRHLEPALRAAVCEQCHLLGDQRVDRLGREPFDYRPGLPLTTFYAVYGRVDERDHKVGAHVEEMKVSRCFRESQGRFGCISCHDPHQVPSPDEKTAYFRQRCLACHERKGCNLPVAVRLAESRADSCTQCHMPRSTSSDVVHAATTDHRVLRRPGASITEPKRSAPGLPLVLLNGDELGREELKSLGRELAIALTSEGPELPDTPQIRQMGSLVLALLDKALAQRPDDLVALRMKAQALALSGRRADALPLIESVLKSAPTYEKALEDYLSYAIDLGKIEAARAPAERAVAVNPWSAAFHERLAYVSLEQQNWAGALHEAREALRLDPFLRFARMFVVQCLLHQKDLTRADLEFATLIKLNPSQRESLEQWFAEQRRNSKIGISGSGS